MNRTAIIMPAVLLTAGLLVPTAPAMAADASRPLATDTLATLEVTDTQADVPGYTQNSFKYPKSRPDLGSKANQWDWVYNRDFDKATLKAENGNVTHGVLSRDPYSGQPIIYDEGKAGAVDIEHIVARSEAWDSGASKWTQQKRDEFANDPLETMAVSASGNRSHGEKDAAGWLPSSGSPLFPNGNPSYDCEYVARQIAVKAKYRLTVDRAEHDAMAKTLASCPAQTIPLDSDGEYWGDDLTGDVNGDGEYTADDLRHIGFGDDTSITGDWRSARLTFDAEHAVHVDRATVPEGWTLKETVTPDAEGLAAWTTTAVLTSPDGSHSTTYTLYSTPFLGTSMTVGGTAIEDGGVTLGATAFDSLGADDVRAVNVPALDDGAVTWTPTVATGPDGSKTATIVFACAGRTVWRLDAHVARAAEAGTGATVKPSGNADAKTDSTVGTTESKDGGTSEAKMGPDTLASTGVSPVVLAPIALTGLLGLALRRRAER